MPVFRLPLNFARPCAWLAVGMLLFPHWASFAQCSCGDGQTDTNLSLSDCSCCCQANSQANSCCGSKQGASNHSCSSSTDACHCSPGCHCGCMQKDDPQPGETPQPTSSNLFEQITWGLSAPETIVGCVPLSLFSHACSSQFQRLIPVSALQRCIALSRFTC